MTATHVYAFLADDAVKIGHTNDLRRRETEIRGDHYTGIPPLGVDRSGGRIVAAWPGNRDDERDLHLRLAHARLQGEWFSYTDEVCSVIAAEAHRHGP